MHKAPRAYFWGKSIDQVKVSRAVARTREYTRHLEHILGEKSIDQRKVSRAVARTRYYTRHLQHILGENQTISEKSLEPLLGHGNTKAPTAYFRGKIKRSAKSV